MSNNDIQTAAATTTSRKLISIRRPVYKQKEFDDEFLIKERTGKKSNVKNGLKKILLKLDPRNMLKMFTIINLVTEYNFKNNLLSDLFSGITGTPFLAFFSFINSNI